MKQKHLETIFILILLVLISGCTQKESTENFSKNSCKYENTSETQVITFQSGCAAYQTDSKGVSTGACIAPTYIYQNQRLVNITCTKQTWRDE